MSSSVLAIDLSSPRGCITARRDGNTVYQAVFQSERSHNASLFHPLAKALDALGRTETGLVVTGTGPGSYTGVRISIATAQGVALSCGWQVIGLPSICTGAVPSYHVLGDARRGMFYHATVHGGRLIQPPILLTRSEAEAALQSIRSEPWLSFDPKPPLPGLVLATPDATALAALAERLDQDELTRLEKAALEPFYLQEAFITTARKAGKRVPEPLGSVA